MKSENCITTLFRFFENRVVRKAGRSKERGSVMPIVVLGAMTFLGAGALAIDISHQVTAGVELQNAADASARAGASALDGTQGGIDLAVSRALATVNTYDWGRPITFTDADITFAVNQDELANGAVGLLKAPAKLKAGSIRFIKVKIPTHQISGVFTKATIGRANLGVARESIAFRSPNGVQPAGPNAPEGTPPVLSDDSVINTVCNWVPLSVLQDPVNFIPLNKPPGSPACGNAFKFTPGCTYVIRAGSNGNGTGFVAGGNFQALAALNPDGSRMDTGGSDLRARLAGGIKYCIHPGDWIGTEPGENGGPVKQGLNARFGDYNGLSSTTYPPDANVKEGITYAQYRSAAPGSSNYQSPNHGTGRPNRRVIIIPIINNTEFNAGRDRVRLYDLGAFFLRTKVSNGGSADVVAEYIGGGYDTAGAYYDPSFVPVSPPNGGRVRVISKVTSGM